MAHGLIPKHRGQEVEVSKHGGPGSTSGEKKEKSNASCETVGLRGDGGLDFSRRSGSESAVWILAGGPFYSPPAVAVAPVTLLQPFDPGVALLRRPQVPYGGHLLRDVDKYVPVADAGFQAALHLVRGPHFNQSGRLLLRPRRVHIRTCFRATLERLIGRSRERATAATNE